MSEPVRSPWAAVRRGVGSLLPGARARRAQTDAFATWWLDQNARALAARQAADPLWIALGDSATQGIGASAPERGWVGRSLAGLRTHRDARWQVVNLSVTGARIDDVRHRQLPQLSDLPAPTLVTCAIGANDMLRGRAKPTLAAIDELLAELPDDTVVATIPRGVRERLAMRVNERIRTACEGGRLRLADVWEATGPPWGGKYSADGFHPNDDGYREWITAFAAPLRIPVADD